MKIINAILFWLIFPALAIIYCILVLVWNLIERFI